MADSTAVQDIVGVFRDEATARDVASRIGDAGVPRTAIHIDDAGSRVEAMKGEMREEADHTIVGPSVGPFTKGMTKGIVSKTAVWALALAILGAALTLFDWPASNLEFGTRLVIALFVGAVTGATIGFVWGGGIGGAKEPSHAILAAERGVVVSVTVQAGVAPTVAGLMRDADPIRLDLNSVEGSPIDTVTTEEEVRREGDQ